MNIYTKRIIIAYFHLRFWRHLLFLFYAFRKCVHQLLNLNHNSSQSVSAHIFKHLFIHAKQHTVGVVTQQLLNTHRSDHFLRWPCKQFRQTQWNCFIENFHHLIWPHEPKKKSIFSTGFLAEQQQRARLFIVMLFTFNPPERSFLCEKCRQFF